MKGQEFGPMDKVRVNNVGVGHLVGYSAEVVAEVIDGVTGKRVMELFTVRVTESASGEALETPETHKCGPDEIELLQATEIPRFVPSVRVPA